MIGAGLVLVVPQRAVVAHLGIAADVDLFVPLLLAGVVVAAAGLLVDRLDGRILDVVVALTEGFPERLAAGVRFPAAPGREAARLLVDGLDGRILDLGCKPHRTSHWPVRPGRGLGRIDLVEGVGEQPFPLGERVSRDAGEEWRRGVRVGIRVGGHRGDTPTGQLDRDDGEAHSGSCQPCRGGCGPPAFWLHGLHGLHGLHDAGRAFRCTGAMAGPILRLAQPLDSANFGQPEYEESGFPAGGFFAGDSDEGAAAGTPPKGELERTAPPALRPSAVAPASGETPQPGRQRCALADYESLIRCLCGALWPLTLPKSFEPPGSLYPPLLRAGGSPRWECRSWNFSKPSRRSAEGN